MANAAAKSLASVHESALRKFRAIQSEMKDERSQCLQDRRFCLIPGAQWEGGLSKQFENKPMLEVNKVHRGAVRIIDEYRNNRITVAFTSKDGAADDQLADTCASLFRSDEKDSCAEEAYDNAFEEAVVGGIGAWRLRAEYEDEESEDDERQRIRLEPIYDADKFVFFDLDAKRQDKSDARFCFVLTPMSRDAYKSEFNDDPASWPSEVQQSGYDWSGDDSVIVAEYYQIEETSDVLRVFEQIASNEVVKHLQSDLAANPEMERELAEKGFEQIREKKIKRQRVHKYLMSGGRVLEDCGFIAGREIPIVVTFGKRWFIDNRERCMGHVRLAKDAQRLKNMQLSRLAELSSISAVKKPMLAPEQIKGFEHIWASNNVVDHTYLPLRLIRDPNGEKSIAGPLGYTEPPPLPQAMAALLELTEQDMKDILGDPDQAEKVVSHVAGKTMEMIEQRIDMQSFIYISNMAKAIRRCGQIWLSMARELYTETGRKMKGVGPRGNVTQIELNRPLTPPGKPLQYENDLTRASFDVEVDVGPSSVSKRQAAFRSITSVLPYVEDPKTKAVLTNLAVENMDGEGIQDVRNWTRMELVRAGVHKPTEEEAKQLAAEAQNAQPDPAAQLYLAEAQKATAQAQKAAADMALTAAQIEKIRAETVETLAGINIERQRAAVETARAISEITAPDAASQPPAPAPVE